MDPDPTEHLKKTIEDLSEQEFKRWKLLKKVAGMVDEIDIEKINQLPELYRLEVKRALDEVGHRKVSAKIEN